MQTFYFKTICNDGITRTTEVFAYNYNEAVQEASVYFDKFYPKHNWVNHISKDKYCEFNHLDIKTGQSLKDNREGRIF